MKTSTQHQSPRFKRHALLAASVIALFGAVSSANAQTFTPTPNSIFVAEGGDAGAYVTTTRRDIVRSGYGLCVRTGSWTVESAMATRVEGSPFSAGCACDEPLMPAGSCTAKVVPAPVAQTPAPTPAPAPAPVATSEKVTIPADALFAFDKATLSADGKTKLENFAGQLKGIQLEAVVAVGHTDRVGTPAYNLKLSNERAQTVKDFLISQGIAADRVFIEGRGETDPVTGDTCKNGKKGESARNKELVSCLAPDRRVVIEAVGSRAAR